jgi:hypothetical protein
LTIHWPVGPRRERLLFDPVEWRDAEGALAALCHDAGRMAVRLEAQSGGAERLPAPSPTN